MRLTQPRCRLPRQQGVFMGVYFGVYEHTKAWFKEKVPWGDAYAIPIAGGASPPRARTHAQAHAYAQTHTSYVSCSLARGRLCMPLRGGEGPGCADTRLTAMRTAGGASAGVSGAAGWFLSFPLDCIKANIQGQQLDGLRGAPPRGAFTVAGEVRRTHCPRALAP